MTKIAEALRVAKLAEDAAMEAWKNLPFRLRAGMPEFCLNGGQISFVSGGDYLDLKEAQQLVCFIYDMLDCSSLSEEERLICSA